MRLRFLAAIGVSVMMALPAQAQVTEAQVGRVVEALRQASKPEKPSPNLYSDWQVEPANVARWSKLCLGREVTPLQFQTDSATARSLVTCVVSDILKQEYKASRNNEALAVQRVAAWWLTGDANRYASREAAPYVQKVSSAYQAGGSVAVSRPALPVAKPAAKPVVEAAPKPGRGQPATFYDRYMQTGYAAVQRKDMQTAMLYFKRALDERPQDRFASQAIRNMEAFSKPNRATIPAPNPSKPSPPPVNR
ncbi:hypothetical protein [Myxacorys almedinensis]|uniref:hypothetical protein n=1 Tax=Myxacorys almedinensis TaxID=2651157 RepID=UPI00192E7A49|nr:hypothetical protein [Myxacorys almedinensis]